MLKRARNLVLVCLTCAASVSAQERVDTLLAQRIKREALDRSQVMETAFRITDVYGPRLTGSPGFRRAGEWSLARLRAYGLSNVHAEPFAWGRSWSVGDFSVQLVQPQYAALIGTPVPWSLGTSGTVAGQVVLVPLPGMNDTLAATYDSFFAAHRGRLRGRILLANAPVARDPVATIFTSLGDSAFDARLRREEVRTSAFPPAGCPSYMALVRRLHLTSCISLAVIALGCAQANKSQETIASLRAYDSSARMSIYSFGISFGESRAAIRRTLGPPTKSVAEGLPARHTPAIDSLFTLNYRGLSFSIIRAGFDGREFLWQTELTDPLRRLPFGLTIRQSTQQEIVARLGPADDAQLVSDTLVLSFVPPVPGGDESIDFYLVGKILRKVRWLFYVD